MRKLKVFLYEPSGCGGVYHYTYSLADGLSKVGLDVTLLTGLNYELKDKKRNFKISDRLGRSFFKQKILVMLSKFRRRSKNIEMSTISRNSIRVSRSAKSNSKKMLLRYFLIWMENIWILLFQGVEIVHIQWMDQPKEDYYFIRLLKLLGISVIYTAHNVLPHDSETIENKNIFSRIYYIVDKIIVHAPDNKLEIINMFGIDKDKIYVIPHGSFEIFFDGHIPSNYIARKELNLPVEKKIILFFGAVRKYKGLETLVESFFITREKIDNLVLLIVGKEGGDEEERKYYQSYLKEISRKKDIICVQEYVPFEKVKYYFSASDLVILPYNKTYQSGVLMLAYASGKPVLVTDTGGLSDAVEVGKSGFVVQPRNPKSISDAVIEFINKPDQAIEMGKYIKDLAENKYSWVKIGNQTKMLYNSMVGCKANRRTLTVI